MVMNLNDEFNIIRPVLGKRHNREEKALSGRSTRFRHTPRPKRSPQISTVYDSHSQTNETVSKIWIYRDKEFLIKRLGDGDAHIVWGFQSKGFLEIRLKIANSEIINSKVVELSKTILRIPNIGKRDPNQVAKILIDDEAGYDRLVKHGVPVPEAYAKDIEFIDELNPSHGAIWLLERMKESISTTNWNNNNNSFDSLNEKDKKVLLFVKHWLTESTKQDVTIIDGLYPRNLMLNEKGDPVVVDFSTPRKEKLSKAVLKMYLDAWAGKNTNIYTFLISDMLEEIRTHPKIALPEFSSDKAG